MNREEILMEISKNSEQEVYGEYENYVSKKALLLGLGIGFFICLGMILFELYVSKKLDAGKITIYLAIFSSSSLYEGCVNKKKTSIIWGVVTGLVAMFFMIIYIGASFL